ncbi:MAG: Uma2 family endonuclease [Cyanobacteria bacterium SID2]|nr:Uma2 family endonuclease [Cyanobacteria bacterium SID2]
MVHTFDRSLTLEEFLAQPETKPASQYIKGWVVQKPIPQGEHSNLQGDLTAAINVLRTQKTARAFPELRYTFDDRSVIPDISVFVADRIPHDETGRLARHFTIAPDWSIEILSPQQAQSKVIQNILHCLEHGTQIGWLIDPYELLVFVYFLDRSTQVFDDLDTPLPVPEFASQLTVTLRDIRSSFESFI